MLWKMPHFFLKWYSIDRELKSEMYDVAHTLIPMSFLHSITALYFAEY